MTWELRDRLKLAVEQSDLIRFATEDLEASAEEIRAVWDDSGARGFYAAHMLPHLKRAGDLAGRYRAALEESRGALAQLEAAAGILGEGRGSMEGAAAGIGEARASSQAAQELAQRAESAARHAEGEAAGAEALATFS